MNAHLDLSNFIWGIANLLRGPYRPPQYERVMLPLVVLRRFDCVLESTKDQVLKAHLKYKDKYQGEALDKLLNKESGQHFHNHSALTFDKLIGDPDNLHLHLVSYINSFSENIRKIFEFFEFSNEIERMREHNILFLVVKRFCEIDLHPNVVDNIEMGLLFEDLIRGFNEQANETAGDHFTPREVIRLMVDILFCNDNDLLVKPNSVRKMLDPTCGTGGMLSEARSYLRKHNLGAKLYVYGQDFNPRSFAVAASDLLMRTDTSDKENSTIRFGDTLINDQFVEDTFDYFIANPPFGVDWKKQQKEIVREHDKLGMDGRFGAGLPRVNDGALLFLQHMISKFEPYEPLMNKDGSRLAIVFNGSPLFTGGAGSGESEIRKWIIEKDYLEAVIAMPEQMFYNTGIGTYIWIVTNRKEARRKNKIHLIDAREKWEPLRRSLGNKRRMFSPENIIDIVKEYGSMSENQTNKIFDNDDFGYQRITVERPLRLMFKMTLERKEVFLEGVPELLDDVLVIEQKLGQDSYNNWNKVDKEIHQIFKERHSKWRAPQYKFFRTVFTETDKNAEPVILKKTGNSIIYEADSKLRDFENIPLKEKIDAYLQREILPHVPDAWIDYDKTKIGYEINFNKFFYKSPDRGSLQQIDIALAKTEEDLLKILKEVVGISI